MLLFYENLSGSQRRAGKKLAKILLRRTPPTEDFDVLKYAKTARGVLNTAYMKPANVVGAFIYTDGNGSWWDDVVLRKGKGVITFGPTDDNPLASEQEALDHLTGLIANIKAMREHPFVETFRKVGYDPERITLLRVSNQSLGDRYVVVYDDALLADASSFEKRWKLENEHGSTDVAELALNMARTIVLHYGKKLDKGPFFLCWESDPDKLEDEARLREAASFLVVHGVINVSAGDVFSVIGDPDKDGMCSAGINLSHGLLKHMGLDQAVDSPAADGD